MLNSELNDYCEFLQQSLLKKIDDIDKKLVFNRNRFVAKMQAKIAQICALLKLHKHKTKAHIDLHAYFTSEIEITDTTDFTAMKNMKTIFFFYKNFGFFFLVFIFKKGINEENLLILKQIFKFLQKNLNLFIKILKNT